MGGWQVYVFSLVFPLKFGQRGPSLAPLAEFMVALLLMFGGSRDFGGAALVGPVRPGSHRRSEQRGEDQKARRTHMPPAARRCLERRMFVHQAPNTEFQL